MYQNLGTPPQQQQTTENMMNQTNYRKHDELKK